MTAPLGSLTVPVRDVVCPNSPVPSNRANAASAYVRFMDAPLIYSVLPTFTLDRGTLTQSGHGSGLVEYTSRYALVGTRDFYRTDQNLHGANKVNRRPIGLIRGWRGAY